MHEITYTDLLPKGLIIEMKDGTLLVGTGIYKKSTHSCNCTR
ncbi:hypothetical protein [Sutcliffiella horikoshii]|nr:hypothetical protein [Sutcliffiella horikoshii]